MALPYNIVNGDIPDATKLMANFNWLATGGGIAAGTFAEMQALAISSPTTPFICIASMPDGEKQVLVYVADVTVGIGGFVMLGGGTPANTEAL